MLIGSVHMFWCSGYAACWWWYLLFVQRKLKAFAGFLPRFPPEYVLFRRTLSHGHHPALYFTSHRFEGFSPWFLTRKNIQKGITCMVNNVLSFHFPKNMLWKPCLEKNNIPLCGDSFVEVKVEKERKPGYQYGYWDLIFSDQAMISRGNILLW